MCQGSLKLMGYIPVFSTRVQVLTRRPAATMVEHGRSMVGG